MLFSSFNCAVFWLYGKPEIRDLKDSKGKADRYLSHRSRSGFHAAGPLEKPRAGGWKGRSHHCHRRGFERYAALATGAVDAVLLSTPYNFTAEEAGFRELVSFIEHDWVELQGCIVAREPLIKSNSALIESFTTATLKGLMSAREKPRLHDPGYCADYEGQADMAAKIYDLTRPAMTVDGMLSEQLQRKAMEHLTKRMDLRESPRVERIYDFSFAEKARADLTAKGWETLKT